MPGPQIETTPMTKKKTRRHSKQRKPSDPRADSKARRYQGLDPGESAVVMRWAERRGVAAAFSSSATVKISQGHASTPSTERLRGREASTAVPGKKLSFAN